VSPAETDYEVLIADRDVIARSACRKLVASRRIPVIEAASPELTMKWLAHRRVSLLILDASIGEPDPVGFVNGILARYPELEVVMTAAPRIAERLRDGLRERTLWAYVLDVWAKPLSRERVDRVIVAVSRRLEASRL
jgi:DNA-binding NtrC family response regulator